jgi:transcriptional regulator of nitric oxide reductase
MAPKLHARPRCVTEEQQVVTSAVRYLACLALVLMVVGVSPAGATTLDRSKLAQHFPAPFIVGEKDPELPLWPLFRQMRSAKGWDEPVLIGYAFESLDHAPVPGFSGSPMNLLIALGPKGEFIDVKVLSQHEPVFVEGLGQAPLDKFVEQYRGLSLTQNIKIATNLNRSAQAAGSANVFIDGVSKATASVRIVNQSLLSASLRVARARLGFAAGRDPDLIGRIKPDLVQPMDFPALAKAGLLVRRTLLERDVESAFKGTVGEGRDDLALRAPEAPFVELLAAHLNVPTVGRNLLNDKQWNYLSSWIEPGDHAFLVATRGRYSFVGDDYTPGAVPDRLTLSQGGLPIELRDLDLSGTLRVPPDWQGPDVKWRVFKVINQASLDPAQPLDFALSVTRQQGQILPEKVRKTFDLRLQLPAAYVDAPRTDNKTWHGIWRDRAWEIAALLLGLLALTALLARPRWITASPRRLVRARSIYLCFTLGFVGWWAQGQLSIVNLTALIQAALDHRSLDFFMYDPMTVVLWGFVLVTFFAWGRGTFCGWLCPFGALQELTARMARLARLPQVKLHTRTDARLKRLKFLVLAGVLVMPFVSAPATDKAVEVEPFKTAITLAFDRSAPFVAWAVALLLLNLFVYKAYCRYLCPLGAGVAVLGRVRMLAWLARRSECGQPCQTCRHRCEYQAIHPSGAIDYDECFQCLDCVAIHSSDALCAPRIAARRKGRVIAVRLADAGAPRATLPPPPCNAAKS